MKVKITGSFKKGDLKVGNVDFATFSLEDHKRIIRELSPHNYHQIPGWISVETGDEDCTLVLGHDDKGEREEKTVLDFQSMYSVHNFGYKNPRILRAIVDYLTDKKAPKALPRALDHAYHTPALVATTKFADMDWALFKSSGVESVETACNTASTFYHDERGLKENIKDGPIFVVANGCFHGRTRGPRSFSSSPSARNRFGPLLPDSCIRHVPFGDAEALRFVLFSNSGLVAAVLLETIQGEGGVIIPPHGYLERVRRVCTEYGVLLIFDEIQTGFGRTGTDWVWEQEDAKPDILIFGKADGGGIIPVSGIAGRKEIMSCIQHGTEGATWSATPIQCIAITESIRELYDNDLSSEARRKGEIFMSFLNLLKPLFPESIVDVRGRGLFGAIETTHDGKKFSLILLEEGVRAQETGETGKILRLSPPLNITEEQLFEATEAIKRALRRLEKEEAQQTFDI